ncbi:MAG TPA: ATP-binding protein, partial [Chloroflexota bacterium]|nr:ATP-binding protein [Chloroflexota bacterium]
QEGSRNGNDVSAALASIEEETLKLADGLELVLNTTRLQDFALDYHIRRVDLLQSVRKVVNARKRQFIRLGIFPAVDAAEDADWHVLTDEKWNTFAIDQILSNALKYGSQVGRPKQRLRLSLSHRVGAVTLAITDEGPGIPPQDVPRVFEPFFTGENGRRYSHATGIGLYLVKRVIDQLGHQVALQSVEGQGTTVTLTYTRAEPASTFHD